VEYFFNWKSLVLTPFFSLTEQYCVAPAVHLGSIELITVSYGASAMYATVTQLLTFEEFLAWDDGSGREFELLDGIPVPLSEPNANHEDLIQRLCAYLENHCQENDLPYVSRQSKQSRIKTVPGEKEKSRKADIVIFAREEWQRMKTLSSSAAAYIPPPGIIEVVSNNWKDDYLTKLAEYEDLGDSYGKLVPSGTLTSSIFCEY
jgi:Uma2 family endonuclease